MISILIPILFDKLNYNFIKKVNNSSYDSLKTYTKVNTLKITNILMIKTYTSLLYQFAFHHNTYLNVNYII